MPNASHSLMSYLRAVSGAWRDDPREDAELLGRFADSGDEMAFQVLVCRHGQLVWRTCKCILGDGPDAEDTFQTVFATLARKARSLRREPLAGWLHRVARRAALNAGAQSKRVQNLERKLRDAAQPKAEQDTDQRELYAVLDEELAGLPERLRIPLVLRYLEGKKLEEVARIVGCSRPVVDKRLRQGEEALRKKLELRGLGAGTIAVLLTDSAAAPAMPAGLITSTTRAAVAFRAGTLAGTSAEAVEKLLHSLSLKGAMRKGWWLVLACIGAIGIGGAGVVVWKMFGNGSDQKDPKTSIRPTISEPAAKSYGQRIDLYGDPLPDGAVARIGTVRFRCPGSGGFSNYRDSVALSPDGKTLISTHNADKLESDGSKHSRVAIRFWDVNTGRQLHEIILHDTNVASIALSHDGKKLAVTYRNCTGGQEEVQIFDTVIRQPAGPSLSGGWPAIFTPDCKTVACKNKAAWGDKQEYFTLYDTRTQQPMSVLKVEKIDKQSELIFTAFTDDGRSLACMERSGSVHLVDVKTGKELNVLKGRQVVALSFTLDGNLVTAGKDKVIRIWNPKTGKELRQLGTMAEEPLVVKCLPDGKTVLATCAGQIRCWDLTTDHEMRPALDCENFHCPQVLSTDGTKFIERVGDTLSIWDAATGKEIGPIARAPQSVMDQLAFSPDSKALATIAKWRESEVRLWDVATGKPSSSIGAATCEMGCAEVAWPLQNVIMTQAIPEAIPKKGLRLSTVRLTTAAASRSTTESKVYPDTVKFSADGQVLARQCYGTFELFEIANEKRLSAIPFHDYDPRERNALDTLTHVTLIFSTDHQVLATHIIKEPSITLWEVATGRKLSSFNLPEHSEQPKNENEKYDTLIGFSPDDRLIATQDYKTKVVSLWERFSGQLRLRLPLPAKCVPADNNVAISADGRLLAMGCITGANEDRSIHVWDLATGKECQCFQGHQSGAGCAGAPKVVFSPDGKRLASAGMDYTVLIWNVQPPPAIKKLNQPLNPQEIQTLKTALIGADAAAAYQAIGKLRQVPEQAVTLATECLRLPTLAPKRTFDSKQITQDVRSWISDLDSDDFQIRRKVTLELSRKLREEESEPVVRPMLVQALQEGKLSIEVNKALTELLSQLQEEEKWVGILSSELTRMCRCVELLELIHSDSACEVLRQILATPLRPEIRREAEAALKRWQTRPSVIAIPLRLTGPSGK